MYHTPIKRSRYHTALFPYDSLNHKWICWCLNRQHKTHTSMILPRAHISVYEATWNGFLVTNTEAAFRLQLLVLFACSNFNTKIYQPNCKLFNITLFQYTHGNFFPSCSSHVDITPKVSASLQSAIFWLRIYVRNSAWNSNSAVFEQY
jgi:hypothetical protein